MLDINPKRCNIMTKKCIILRKLLPIGFAGAFALFLLINTMAGAVMPLPTYGGPWAGVDFDALLDGNSYVFYGEYEAPLSDDSYGNITFWDELNPVLYKVLGEEENDGYLTIKSNYPVDAQTYNLYNRRHYDDSFIRKWLNDGFLNSAFSYGEQGAMVATDVATRAFDHANGTEKTGLLKLDADDITAVEYPLTTKDTIYLPWARSYANYYAIAYWSSGYADDKAYEIPLLGYYKDGISSLMYTRLRTPVYRSTAPNYLFTGTVFVQYYSNNNIGIGTEFGPMPIIPIFKLDPKKVVFASPIVAANPRPHQLLASPAYPLPATGKAYKLTVLDDSLDPSSGDIYNGTNVVGRNDTLPVNPGGQLALDMEIGTARDSGYSIRYKIVGSDNNLLGYGLKSSPLSSGMNSFTINAFGLDGQPLASGTYDAYVWLQKDNATTSFAASTPRYFKISVGNIILFAGEVLYQTSPTQANISLYNSEGICIANTGTATDGSYTLSIPIQQEGERYTLVVTKLGYLSYTNRNLTLADLEELKTIDIRQLAGDVNGDGIVNAVDLTCLLSEFNRAPLIYTAADIDGNGIVNAADLTYLLAGFNKRNVVIEN
jgi:hypothetical protein